MHRGPRQGRGDRRARNRLRLRRRRLPDRAGAHGRRAHHRTADRLEQGVHRGRAQALDPPVQHAAQPGNEAFGIQWSFDGKFAIFVGGFPIVVNGEVVGGVGLSGGNGEQDIACGLAALQALHDLLAPQKHTVLVQADIKK